MHSTTDILAGLARFAPRERSRYLKCWEMSSSDKSAFKFNAVVIELTKRRADAAVSSTLTGRQGDFNCVAYDASLALSASLF